MLDIPAGGFDACIFDCDGTLADTMPLHLLAFRYALGRQGFPEEEFTDELHHNWAGMPGPAIVRRLNERYGMNMPPDQVEQDKIRWYLDHHSEIQPVHEVVGFARSQAGIRPMAVASGSDIRIVMAALDGLGIAHLFETVITPRDVSRGKPHPDMFLLAAERLKTPPARCLVFEDGELGIQAAQAAGMLWVRVPSGPAAHRSAATPAAR